MIKNHNGKKLGITSSHRKSLIRNMAIKLSIYESIRVTLPRAKELVSFFEKLITRAKESNLNSIRIVNKKINNKIVVKKIFDVLMPRYKNRNGGYTRIIRDNFRRGDNANIVIVKLVL
jgi:large subunit ribosomal protein L17